MNSGYQGYSMGGGGGGGFNNNNNYGSNYNDHNQGGGGYGGNNYGQGGDNTGGFMPFKGSQDTQPRGERDPARDTIHPMNIMQILELPANDKEDMFLFDTVDVKNVTVVARVSSITVQTTKVVYKIEDGTGTIEAHQWLDTDKQEAQSLERKTNGVVEGAYVRVFGAIKTVTNRRLIQVAGVKHVQDMNEVFSHVQEIIYHYFYCTKGPLNQLGNPSAAAGAAGRQVQQGGAGAGASFGGAGGGQQEDPQAKKLAGAPINARRAFAVIRKANRPKGIPYFEVAQELGLSEAEIREAGDFLTNRGVIYTPDEDDHWCELVM